jgi:hypothetical protein
MGRSEDITAIGELGFGSRGGRQRSGSLPNPRQISGPIGDKSRFLGIHQPNLAENMI